MGAATSKDLDPKATTYPDYPDMKYALISRFKRMRLNDLSA